MNSPLDAQTAWELFQTTGNPEAYILFRLLIGENNFQFPQDPVDPNELM